MASSGWSSIWQTSGSPSQQVYQTSGSPSQQPNHIVWGPVDLHNSASTSTSSEASQCSTKPKKKIINRPVKAEEILFISQQSESSSLSSRAAHREEEAQHEQQEGRASGGRTTGAQPTEALPSTAPLAGAVDTGGREGLPSAGSALHDSGRCKPCLFLLAPVGCSTGVDCEFCHLWHDRKTMPRQSKSKRDRFKKLMSRVESSQIMNHEGEAEEPTQNVRASPSSRPSSMSMTL